MNKKTKRDDLQIIAQRLSRYRDRCDELLLLLDGDLTPPESQVKVRALYASLKNDLKTDARNALRDSSINPKAASAFFEPAVNGAAIHLRPATNSNPMNSDWFSAVYNARIDITHHLGQIDGVGALLGA